MKFSMQVVYTEAPLLYQRHHELCFTYIIFILYILAKSAVAISECIRRLKMLHCNLSTRWGGSTRGVSNMSLLL